MADASPDELSIRTDRDAVTSIRASAHPLARHRLAPMLTHGSLAILTLVYFAIVSWLPLWIALVPGVIVAHRIGTLLHEYIHGIPFRRYRDNHIVVTIYDGILLMFGTMEMFRVSHLHHHRWLNTDDDGAVDTARKLGTSRTQNVLAGLAVVQYLLNFWDALRGRSPNIHRGRMLAAAIISVTCIAIWTATGNADVVGRIVVIALVTMLVPVSLRSAIEHHAEPGNDHFANEYRVVVPLFNLNRHIHHHEDPTVPWYLLQWRTEHPLPAWRYVAHWVHVYVKRDYALMRPMRVGDRRKTVLATTPRAVPRA